MVNINIFNYVKSFFFLLYYYYKWINYYVYGIVESNVINLVGLKERNKK